MPSTPRRRLATVLCFDIVGSTALASELGDERWREFFALFWRTVQRQLKRGGGREQDLAGDGCLAAFAEPAQALRTAAALILDAQGLGVDIRCGVHTGECEVLDGKLRGVAVHIGARVMALAGPAEILVTATVRDLTAGSGVRFEQHGNATLKGVDGDWVLFRATAVGDAPLPLPLSAAETLGRRAALELRPRGPRWSRTALIAAAALGALAMAVITPLLTLGSNNSTLRQKRLLPITLVRIDPVTEEVTGVVRDRYGAATSDLVADHGTLWQGEKRVIVVERDAGTGRVRRRIKVSPEEIWVQAGFGSVWVLRENNAVAKVDRIDGLSGRSVTINLPPTVSVGLGLSALSVGAGRVWVLDETGDVTAIDPATNRPSAPIRTGVIADWLQAFGPYVWLTPTFPERELVRLNPRTGGIRRYPLPNHPWFLIPSGQDFWMWDQTDRTLSLFDPTSGRTDAPRALAGSPDGGMTSGFGRLWVAAGNQVDWIYSDYSQGSIRMPDGVCAADVAVDTPTNTVWVSTGRNSEATSPQLGQC